MINDGFAFNDAIMRMLLARGFTQFTEAQKGFFPHVMKGENALLISPTGSGKTEAAMVPIFQKLMDEPGDPISVLYVTPLRALNRDMQSRLLDYSSHTGITIQLKHSDMTQAERRRVTTHPPSISSAAVLVFTNTMVPGFVSISLIILSTEPAYCS